jgi:hypothetical protein
LETGSVNTIRQFTLKAYILLVSGIIDLYPSGLIYLDEEQDVFYEGELIYRQLMVAEGEGMVLEGEGMVLVGEGMVYEGVYGMVLEGERMVYEEEYGMVLEGEEENFFDRYQRKKRE